MKRLAFVLVPLFLGLHIYLKVTGERPAPAAAVQDNLQVPR